MKNLSIEDIDVNMEQMQDLNELLGEQLEGLIDYKIKLSRAKNEKEANSIDSMMLYDLKRNLSKMETLNMLLSESLIINQKALQNIINDSFSNN